MSSTTIRIAESDADLEKVAAVLMELRSAYDRAKLLSQVKDLGSGVQRFPAHRFYLRQGFNIASHHFSITDLKA